MELALVFHPASSPGIYTSHKIMIERVQPPFCPSSAPLAPFSLQQPNLNSERPELAKTTPLIGAVRLYPSRLDFILNWLVSIFQSRRDMLVCVTFIGDLVSVKIFSRGFDSIAFAGLLALALCEAGIKQIYQSVRSAINMILKGFVDSRANGFVYFLDYSLLFSLFTWTEFSLLSLIFRNSI